MPPIAKRFVQLFTLQGTVDRATYFSTGAALMVFKYLIEAGLVLQATGRVFRPDDFLNPWINAREQFLDGAPEWFGPAWAIWTIPFVWIALAMSARRLRDSGKSPWYALLILVPIINFLAMLVFAARPTAPPLDDADEILAAAKARRQGGNSRAYAAALLGMMSGFLYGFLMILLSIYVADSYGAALFFGLPLVTGITSGFVYNRYRDRGSWATAGVALLPMLFVAGAMLVLAFEGLICIVMAAPIMVPLSLMGGVLGRHFAEGQRPIKKDYPQLFGCLIILPLLGGIETFSPAPKELVVTTSVEIAAPAETVWDLVVDFPPITTPDPWYFRWGIAAPREAVIDGEGVGATRYCKFTTGEFVEPITVWDIPRRLAFDVTEQPEPMFELTPYRHVHPPHLDGAFRSTHGEFRLVELPNGNTRLEGRTWYQLDMGPQGYWTIWTDAIVHRIHLRVLEHIKLLAEAESPD